MNSVRALYDKLIAGQVNAVAQFITEQQEETLHLDFKQAQNQSGPLALDDRKNLAKGLSGFANSDGGVLVWGIACKHSGHGEPDVAQETKPISKLALFLSDLQKATAEIVSPSIPGVEHTKIETEQGSDKGYVVSYVPRGEGEPHMARAKDQHRFYYRSGSSFLKMEPFMLADRYGRRPQPKLIVECRAACARDSRSSGYIFEIEVGLRNVGLGIALHPAIEIRENFYFSHNEYGSGGNKSFGGFMPLTIGKKTDCFFAGGANIVVYPNRSIWVTKFETDAMEIAVARTASAVDVPYSLFCEGFSVVGKLNLNLERIWQQGLDNMIDAIQSGCAVNEIIS